MVFLQMKIFRNSKELIKLIKNYRSLGFVPTMGALHKGHIKLIKLSQKKCVNTIVSIFVNPNQFNNKNDYKRYPRNISKDLSLLKKLKIDLVFIPTKRDMYNKKRLKKIILDNFHKKLCGKFRPGHFIGVVDIVDRFLNLIRPKYIFLGEKDYQQLVLIKKFISNKYKTKVIPCKTVRNSKGLALSSRNYLLNKNEKKIGSKIYKLLKKSKFCLKKSKSKSIFLKKIQNKIINFGVRKIEYLKLIDLKTNSEITKKTKKYNIFISYYFRNIRLIDNV